MSTINISLPSQQANFVDSLVEKYGFANRSEFIRSIIRLVINKQEILDSAVVFPFNPPKEKSIKKIVSGLTKTKHYSKAFINNVKEGLANSDYFKK